MNDICYWQEFVDETARESRVKESPQTQIRIHNDKNVLDGMSSYLNMHHEVGGAAQTLEDEQWLTEKSVIDVIQYEEVEVKQDSGRSDFVNSSVGGHQRSTDQLDQFNQGEGTENEDGSAPCIVVLKEH